MFIANAGFEDFNPACEKLTMLKHMYIYIYIYVCVCVYRGGVRVFPVHGVRHCTRL